MNAIELTATPSLNILKGRWAMMNWKKKYLKELRNYDLIYGLKLPAKRTLIITRYGSRELDKDNFTGGLKPLLDALKTLKIIWDDRNEYLEFVCTQEKCIRDLEKTLVEIEEYKFK